MDVIYRKYKCLPHYAIVLDVGFVRLLKLTG